MPGEYDSDRDRRVCVVCAEVFVGGPTGTGWEMHDHDQAEHPGHGSGPCPCGGCQVRRGE